MSIPVLTQVYEEVRRLAIAGSAVAPGDFRLKKLLPPLEQAGAKAPVFAKVAEAVKRLVESNEKTSSATLLELTSLLTAILYTQGETGAAGELKPLATTDLGLAKTQASARILKPLLEALTTTGSGRLETIREAHERGSFRDLRLISPALAALDDTYSEISELIAQKVLPLYGPAILPELRAKFDPKKGMGHARRLQLMFRLDPAAAREHVQKALDEGSKEVRIAAIECLGGSPDDLPFLLEQVKAKAKEVRIAALKALGTSDVDGAVKVLCNAIEGADFALAVAPIRASRNPALTAFLLGAAEKEAGALLAGKEKNKPEKNKQKLGAMNERMLLLLECLRGRDDKRTEKLLLYIFGQIEQLAAVKGEPSGQDVVERLVSIMVAGSSKVQSALVDAHQTLPASCLAEAFVAARKCRKPAEVFKLFSPYLAAKVDEKKKTRDPAYEKREVIRGELTNRHWSYDPDGADFPMLFDPQWLDLAARMEDVPVVLSLARPGHAGANQLLSKLFKQGLAKSPMDNAVQEVLATMVRVAHPQATDSTVEFLGKVGRAKTSYYGYYGLGYLVAGLPKEAVPKLEALLPTLPEKMIDQLHDYVTQLKNS